MWKFRQSCLGAKFYLILVVGIKLRAKIAHGFFFKSMHLIATVNGFMAVKLNNICSVYLPQRILCQWNEFSRRNVAVTARSPKFIVCYLSYSKLTGMRLHKKTRVEHWTIGSGKLYNVTSRSSQITGKFVMTKKFPWLCHDLGIGNFPC